MATSRASTPARKRPAAKKATTQRARNAAVESGSPAALKQTGDFLTTAQGLRLPTPTTR